MNSKTTAQKIAALRRQSAELTRQIREIRANPPPPYDPTAAFRRAVAPPPMRKRKAPCLTLPETVLKQGQMPTAPPSFARIAASYGSTRQNIAHCTKRLGMTQGDWRDPDKVFRNLLTLRASKIRTRLSDPSTREKIRIKLNP